MRTANRIEKKWLSLLAATILLGVSGAAVAQVEAGRDHTQMHADRSVRPTLDQKLASESPAATQTPTPQDPAKQEQPKPSQPKPEVKITPREAEELFHSVDEILSFDSQQTGLPIKKQVKRRLTSRDEVVRYLTKHMKDEDVKRLQRSELVLKKFGLLPRGFNMEKLLVDLLREEVAGYYDPKTKTVNLLDWVPMEEQEPVLAHELTHALQDQAIGLDKWMKKGEKDLGEIRKDPTSADIENDEMDSAREAVVEGQAQAIMFQYALAPAGRSIADSPDLVDTMEEETLTGTPNTQVFNDAPIFMKESLTFPYSYGMEFVIKLMEKGGKRKAFADVLANPPHTTRQIMQPETYLSGEKIEPMRIPEFKRDFKDYLKFDIGAMGEFDVAVLIEQYAGKKLSKGLYPEWRGGYYYAVRPRNDAAAPLGLLYVSRWSSAETASEFAGIYARSLEQRYKRVKIEPDGTAFSAKPELEKSPPGASMPDESVSDRSLSDRSMFAESMSAESRPDKSVAQSPEIKVAPLKGKHVWTTEEGTVVIEEQGDTVFVTESLDAATVDTVEKEVFSASK